MGELIISVISRFFDLTLLWNSFIFADGSKILGKMSVLEILPCCLQALEFYSMQNNTQSN